MALEKALLTEHECDVLGIATIVPPTIKDINKRKRPSDIYGNIANPIHWMRSCSEKNTAPVP
ncbi:MAG: hypothetical protein HUJ51_01820 [Eggerthellaceae bacterium]|nr:hypothetical protein [Eggerthellaceae bacterium]